MAERYDFSGWATKNDLRCSDGRTIRRDAFKDNDGQIVPLVWQHQHNDPSNVLGHALLENRPEGVYAYGSFNDTAEGQRAKALVEHGDITSLSIFANKLKQSPAKDVLHGVIREVSLVLSPANPGASIEFPVMAHGDDFEEIEDEATIYTGEPLYLAHADDSDEEEADDGGETVKDVFDTLTEKQKKVVYFMISKALEQEGVKPESQSNDGEEVKHADDTDDGETVQDVFDSLSDKQKNVVYFMIGQALEDAKNETVKHADTSDEEDGKSTDKEGGAKMADSKEKTVKDVFDELTEEQKNVVYFMIGQALEDAKKGGSSADEEDETAQHSYYGGYDMKYNVFDNSYDQPQETLSHAEIQTIFTDARRMGSLRDAVLQHMQDGVLAHAVYNTNPDGTQGEAQTYGMANIDYLFPDAQTLGNMPETINANTAWVKEVMSGVHHTPFARIKTVAADITMDEARAKGYIKGNQKKDEVFALLKRETNPQTVYKKQKMDKDDITDITSFDVVTWLKAEMRGKLDEELARAFLISDGRAISDDDKIKEDRIRPIATDADLFTIKSDVTPGTDDAGTAKNIRRAILEGMKTYDGSGTPTLFIANKWLNELMLLEDGIGHPMYETEEKLAAALRVKKLVPVAIMDNKTADSKELIGIVVNLADYNVGADKGGAVSLFDDFDIDYNQQKFLIETRCSAALTKPHSAIRLTVGSNG